MDYINEKILDAYNKSILGINEVKKEKYFKEVGDARKYAKKIGAKVYNTLDIYGSSAMDKKGPYVVLKKKPKVDEAEDLNESFITDSKISDAVFKDLHIATNDLIMKVVIPKLKKIDEKIQKKYDLDKETLIGTNQGSAYLHDVLRQLISDQLQTFGKAEKKLERRKK